MKKHSNLYKVVLLIAILINSYNVHAELTQEQTNKANELAEIYVSAGKAVTIETKEKNTLEAEKQLNAFLSTIKDGTLKDEARKLIEFKIKSSTNGTELEKIQAINLLHPNRTLSPQTQDNENITNSAQQTDGQRLDPSHPAVPASPN